MFWRGFLEVNREGPKDSSGRPRKTLPEEPEDSSGRPRKTAGRRRKTLPEGPEDSSGRPRKILPEDLGRLEESSGRHGRSSARKKYKRRRAEPVGVLHPWHAGPALRIIVRSDSR